MCVAEVGGGVYIAVRGTGGGGGWARETKRLKRGGDPKKWEPGAGWPPKEMRGSNPIDPVTPLPPS